MCIRETLCIQKFETTTSEVLSHGDLQNLFSICIGKDNQACIFDAQNSTLTDLSKHVDLKFQFLLKKVKMESISLQYVSSDNMVADIITKKLRKNKLKHLIGLTCMK